MKRADRNEELGRGAITPKSQHPRPGRRAAVYGTLYAVAVLFVAFIFALIVSAGATKWVPPGTGGINHVLLPALAFPITWVWFSLWLYTSKRQARAWALSGLLGAVSLGAVVYGLMS